MKFLISLFFFLFFISQNLLATNIRVIDINIIVNNNQYLSELVSNIQKDQELHRIRFNKIELELENELKRIDELKLILDKNELEKEINIYNIAFNKYNIEIERFNDHYESEISKFKNKILEKLIEYLKKYSLENKIDLILDTNNYILSSNTINITELVNDEIKKIKFDTSFEKFK